MEAKEYLGFSVLAAGVTTLGTIFGHALKELFLARSFERWKNRQTLETIQRRYRDPIVLSALELANRVEEICTEYPTDFLSSNILTSITTGSQDRTAIRDHYFRTYKLQSSIYRLSSFLGWLELYRQDLVFLDSGAGKSIQSVDKAIRDIRSDLADGHLNKVSECHSWTDMLIFREEQRAIGEIMITGNHPNRVVLGYSEFTKLHGDSSSEQARWLSVVSSFLLDHEPPKDFRLTRLRRLHVHLVDLVNALDPVRLQKHHIQARLDFVPICGLDCS